LIREIEQILGFNNATPKIYRTNGRYIQEYLLLWPSLLRQDFGGYIGILLPSPFEALYKLYKRRRETKSNKKDVEN